LGLITLSGEDIKEMAGELFSDWHRRLHLASEEKNGAQMHDNNVVVRGGKRDTALFSDNPYGRGMIKCAT